MSANYAAGLSEYENKGKCGIPELEESLSAVGEKVQTLANLITHSKHAVFHTGAGVSTSAGIPDFRGPKGVWTLEKQGRSPDMNVSFDEAKPTFTHMALCSLEDAGYIKLELLLYTFHTIGGLWLYSIPLLVYQPACKLVMQIQKSFRRVGLEPSPYSSPM